MRYLIQLLLILSSPILFAQTTRVADNNFNAPTGPNVYATIQAAVNAASPGDIIQVQPSPTVYGSVSINKPNLTLMGIGFNLDKEIPLQSSMNNITLTNNVDGTSEADNTIITGLTFGTIYLASNTGPAYLLENTLIQNCSLYQLTNSSSYSPIDGLEVRNCYLRYTHYLANQFSTSLNNGIFRNNLILGGFYFGAATSGNNIISNNIIYNTIWTVAEGGNTTILNNNFIGATGVDYAFSGKMKNGIVNNNIFYGVTPSIAAAGTTSSNFELNTFSNNLVFSSGDDTMPPTGGLGNAGSGNITGVSPNFTNVQLLGTWSSAYDFTLQAGSPALGAGSDGTDIGISGGASYAWPDANFVMKTTAAPVIQILNTSTVINPGDNLPVRIKANSN
jgi:hypothetical protein